MIEISYSALNFTWDFTEELFDSLTVVDVYLRND